MKGYKLKSKTINDVHILFLYFPNCGSVFSSSLPNPYIKHLRFMDELLSDLFKRKRRRELRAKIK